LPVMKNKFTNLILKYFIQGLILITPVTITIWAVFKLFTWVDDILKDYITSIIGIEIPGLGFILLLLSITFIGLIGSTIVFTPIWSYFDRVLTKAPLIKLIYTGIKDLVSAFVGQKKRFTEPVLVRISSTTDMEKLGFITNKDLSIIGLPTDKVAVYLPHSYAWSGNLVIVPAKHVRAIDASTADVMKFIISAGVTNIEDTEEHEK
jgi:uncharacterized membrane protein